MTSGIQKILLPGILIATVLLAVWHDHEITRPARIGREACYHNMTNVRDGFLRYEREHGTLPERIDDLVPGYVSSRMIYCKEPGKNLPMDKPREKDKFAYSKTMREFRDPEPHVSRGVVTRKTRILKCDIPAQELPPVEKAPPAREEVRNAPGPDSVVPSLTLATILVQAIPGATPPQQATNRATESAAATAPPGPAVPIKPPDQSIVIEAEMFSDLNYGWEIKADPSTGNGAYIIAKKGVANNTALKRGLGDFYNVGNNLDIPRLFYTFRIPESGSWTIQARVRTGGTRCANGLAVFLDEDVELSFGSMKVLPFNWFWDPPKTVRLSEGLHNLRIYPHECGVGLDQIIVTKTAVTGNVVFASTPPTEPHGDRNLFVVHDLNTCVISIYQMPRIKVWVRQVRKEDKKAKITTSLALPAGEKELVRRDLDLSKATPLACIPIDLSSIDPAKLPRREFLLKTVVTVDGEVRCTTTTALMRPFRWNILGMLPFAEITSPFPPDVWGKEKQYDIQGTTNSWIGFQNKWHDHFGVMDFGLMFANNQEHAPEYRTVYAQTTFKVGKEDDYLFKVITDDQMILWLDDEAVLRSEEFNCAIRNAHRIRLHLSAGEHRLQYRLNQAKDRWQAAVFIRTKDDQVATDIEGVE